MVIRGFRKCGISLSIDGSKDDDINIKGIKYLSTVPEDLITLSETFVSTPTSFEFVPEDIEANLPEANDYLEIPQEDEALISCADVNNNEVSVDISVI